MVYNPPYRGTCRGDLETYIAARINSPSSYFTGTQLGVVKCARDIYNHAGFLYYHSGSQAVPIHFSTLWNNLMESMSLEPHVEMYVPYSQQYNPAYAIQTPEHESQPSVQCPTQKKGGERAKVPKTTQRWVRREIDRTIPREKRQKQDLAASKAADLEAGVPVHRFQPSPSSSANTQNSPSQEHRAMSASTPSNPHFTGHTECDFFEYIMERICNPHDFFSGAQLQRVLAALKSLNIEPGNCKPRDTTVAQDRNKLKDLVETVFFESQNPDLLEKMAQWNFLAREKLTQEKREQTPEPSDSGSETTGTESPTQDSRGVWSDDIWEDDVLPVPPRTPSENPPFKGRHGVALVKYILIRLTDPSSYYSHPQVDAVRSGLKDYPTVAIDIYSYAAENYTPVPKVFERFLLSTHPEGEIILEAIKDVGCPHRRVDMQKWNKIIAAMGLEPHFEEPFMLEGWERSTGSESDSTGDDSESVSTGDDSDSDEMDSVHNAGEDVTMSEAPGSPATKTAKRKRASGPKNSDTLSSQLPISPCNDPTCECSETPRGKGKGKAKEVQPRSSEPRVSFRNDPAKSSFLNAHWTAKFLQTHPDITAVDMIAIIESQMDSLNFDRNHPKLLIMKKYVEIHPEATAVDMFAVLHAVYC